MADSNQVTRIVSVIKPKSSFHRWLPAVIAALVIIAAVVSAIVITDKNGGGSAPIKPAHLLFVDAKTNKITAADQNLKEQYKIAYPKYSYANFEASSPKGETLFSLSIGSPASGAVFIKDGKAQTLGDKTVQALRSSIILDSSYRAFFTDEDNILMVTCPAGASCKLVRLDINSGGTQQILDTGAVSSSILPSVYLLGVSDDGKTAYLRVMADNKLSSNKAAVYEVDLAANKVIKTHTVTTDAGYSPALSPDKKKIVYKTTDSKGDVAIRILDLGSGKETTAAWKKGALPNTPSLFQWSPDSQKVSFISSDSFLPRPKQDSTFPIYLAYLDIAKDTVTELQTINDSAHNNIASLGWLDTKNVVYEQDNSIQPYDYASPTVRLFKQDVSTKKISDLKVSNGQFIQIVRY